ncbi:uncharacterized protein LOC120002202 [Tripterygium wilfordii]|uniref:uncharacterized protein LOC120002202 n=1 Tax=Tripterygium wilfordii TaxID=458696 RepID=UPI0018F83155|nr:uncharacterized protein LOC120002202 [Tripterygium wilfordii]
MVKRAVEGDFQLLLEEQRREFKAAKTVNSDFDFAYNLQMQEAIKASVSTHPCTSQSTPADTVLIPEDDALDYVSLLLEDIDRFDLERKDREQGESLMRQMREDLDRRIHDQQFSSYIMSVPEREWQKYGDNYERPYEVKNACSSSSSSKPVLVNKEVFRLYFKGLVSEERIRDMKVIVAGIGFAICDSRDNVIFEVNKGLECGGEWLSGEAAEIEALIEGLRAAVDLDLERVNFFCDDYMVYQYVTRRLQPKQSKIAKLVDEAACLQRKFEYFEPSLVERNEIKFAFKLARNAIVSQIIWPAETSKGKSLKETCLICFEDTDVDQIFSVDGCLHRYCYSCMKQHVEVKLLNGMDAQCPNADCNFEVSIDSCGKFLDPKLVALMSQRKKEALVAVTERVYCPHLRCSALMSKDEVLEYTKPWCIGAEISGARKCVKCQYFFCINCKAPWHYNMTCQQYQRLNPKTEDAILNSLAKKKLWRQCVKCNHMVELASGCYHIYCRCGYEFCYTCGAEWKNKTPTCSCPIWAERNIIHR